MHQLLSADYLLTALAVPVTFSAAIILLGSLIERLMPAQQQSWSAIRLNLAYLVPYIGLHMLLGPVATTMTIGFVNLFGGGLIILPSSGWGFVGGLAAFTIAMDLGESAFHLAQHKIPILWKFHALHHSDTQVNVSTTNRHCWLELLLKTITIYVAVGLIFKANAPILAGYNIIALWNYFSHMNIRVGLGRFSWLINSPQYHRLHHSSKREDYDMRYAAIFPLFDLICGTYRRPKPGEYAETGLENGLQPEGVADAVLWPLRFH